MMANRTASSALPSFSLVLLAGLVLLSGCRTYGKRGATEKMLPEMRQSVLLFASDLEQARSSYNLLQEEAEGDSALGLVAEEYEQALNEHEETLAENRAILEEFEDDLPDYRVMHRTFGAMLSAQQTARNRYRSLTKAVRYPGVTTRMEGTPRRAGSRARAIPDTALRARDESFTEGRYYVAPIFYERLRNAGEGTTMRQALTERTQRRSQSGRLSRPDVVSTSPAAGATAPAGLATDSVE